MSFVIFILILWGVVLFTWLWIKPRLPSPPMLPGALPLIGHSHLIIGGPIYFWETAKRIFNFCTEKGGVIEMRVGFHRVYVITDLDDSLVVANTCYDKPNVFFNLMKDLFNNGLFTANVSTWTTHRKLLNSSFNQQVLNTYLDVYNVQARSLVSRLASKVDEDLFDVRNYLIKFLMKTVNRTSLGLQLQDQNMINTDYAHATETFVAKCVERTQNLWLYMPYVFNRSSFKTKHNALIKIVNDGMNSVITTRRCELKGNYNPGKNSSTPGKSKPILDQLLHLAENQDMFTDDEIRGHLNNIVAATFDTTASAMTYTLLFIGSYQDIQERVYKELKEVLGDQDTDLTKEDLSKLVYLDAVLKETLRLYPSGPIIARKPHTDVQLKNYTLPANSTAIVAIYGINRHPMLWGADAEQFKPERWLNRATLPNNLNAFATFSFGRRDCIGKSYGMMIMKTALAHILRRYHVTGNINNVVTQCDIIIKPVSGHHISLKLRTE